jgi:hypothetical protein
VYLVIVFLSVILSMLLLSSKLKRNLIIAQNLTVLSYMLSVSKVQVVVQNIIVREVVLCTLKENLVMAQNHMKQQVDQGRSKRQFVEEDQVFLRLQPYNKTSLKADHC